MSRHAIANDVDDVFPKSIDELQDEQIASTMERITSEIHEFGQKRPTKIEAK